MTKWCVALGIALMAYLTVAESNNEMVDSMMRCGALENERVAAVMRAVDRGDFCRNKFDAYVDRPVPIGFGQTISAPHMHALSLRLLLPALRPGARVLDVGSGSGYLTACLAEAVQGDGGFVVGIDRNAELVEWSKQNVRKNHADMLEKGSVMLHVGDGWKGDPEHAPFDVIHVGAAASKLPRALVEQLKPGGLMIIPLGIGEQDLFLVRKDDLGNVHSRAITPVVFVPLVEE